VPALGYASVRADASLDGPEVHHQRQTIEKACRGLGLDLIDVVRDHEPSDPSAERRPGLLYALERIGDGEAACLVVSDLTRLSGTPEELAALLDELDERRGRLVAVDVGLDSATPAGQLAVSHRPGMPPAEVPLERPPAPEPAEPPRVREPVEEAATEPVEEIAPEPVEEAATEPVEEIAPEPVEEAVPEPVEEAVPEPVEEAVPEPVKEAAPESVEEAAPELAAPEQVEQSPAETAPAPPPSPPAPMRPSAALMRALGYASVPAEDDPEAPQALEAQRRAIERTCERLGLELVEVVREREPTSGKALDRAGISYLIDRLAAGDASCLVVSGLDRLSRSVSELGTLVQWLEKSDVRLVAVELDLDTLSPGGRAAARALASVGGWERERLSERTRKGLAAARAKRRAGTTTGPDWTAIQKRIATMRADGMTLQAIADVLNDEGVPTPRGGVKWRPSSVQTAAGYKRRSRAKSLADLPAVDRASEGDDPPESA
jgi:DNA invertase Pin-like site-specific DNA recombinase